MIHLVSCPTDFFCDIPLLLDITGYIYIYIIYIYIYIHTFVILSAILLPIKSPVVSDIFWIALSEAVLNVFVEDFGCVYWLRFYL